MLLGAFLLSSQLKNDEIGGPSTRDHSTTSSAPDHLYMVVDHLSRVGYINREGDQKIPFQYKFALPFTEGRACVRSEDGSYGYINTRNQYVIEPRFSSCDIFRNGRAWVKRDGEKGWHLIDADGTVLADTGYRHTERFTEEGRFAAVQYHGEFHYVNRNGEMVTRLGRYLAADSFRDGRGRVRTRDGWGLIDTRGETVIAPQYENLEAFGQGLAAVRVNDKWGYVDRHGDRIIEPRFDRSGRFSQGRAPVKYRSRLGLIDRDGTFVVLNTKFSRIAPFSQGLAAYTTGDTSTSFGFLGRHGTTRIKPEFDGIWDRRRYFYSVGFRDERAPVLEEQDGIFKLGWIDKNGRFVHKPSGRINRRWLTYWSYNSEWY